MKSIIYTLFLTALWILNLFNGTGLGTVYHTTERARLIIYIVFIIVIIFEFKGYHLWVAKQNFLVFGGMAFLFVLIPLIKGIEKTGLHYLYVFALVYILSKFDVCERDVKLIGLVYLVMGMGILYIYDFGSVLSGWNGNSIGMIGLYSYLFFLISYYDLDSIKSKLIIIAVTIIYLYLIEPTASRSCIWFGIIAVLFALSIIPREFLVKTDKRYYYWLLLPLFIALLVISVAHGPYMQELDSWSLQRYNKSFFNGRDRLWENGFEILSSNLLFGSGKFAGNLHNCLITALTAYGVVGGTLWIMSFQRILSMGRAWIGDTIVVGGIITFLMMYIQQSVELGIISETPNILPYVVLGVVLGRIKSLRSQSRNECAEF